MVEITVTGVERGVGFLARMEKGIPSATSRAINDGARFARTLTRRGVMSETGLQGKYIAPSLRMAFAKPTNLVGGVGAITRNIPLIAFYRRAFKSGRGIAGETYSLGTVPPRAFYIQWQGSGNRGIYQRAGRPRWPVRKVYGPGLVEIIERKLIFHSLPGPVGERYRTRLLHHLERMGGEGVTAESDGA